jgi:hypothetical protein
MPTSVGPNPALDSNIIFSYDVGDTSNSYRGQPTTNAVGNLNSFNPLDLYTWASSGNTSTWSRDTTIFPSPVNGIPLKEVSSGTDSYSSTYNNPGNNISAASSGQTWTVSVYALAAAGTNLQVWIFGANSSGNYIELNAQSFTATGIWQRISISMTFTNGSTAYVQARVATATNGATVWWDGLQIEQKSYPTQFTVGTRSATEGLVPLIGNSTIDLSNISFNSAAQITFDGSDDYLTVSNPSNYVQGTSDFSLEFVFNKAATGGNNGMLLEARGASLVGFFLYVNMSDSVTVLALNYNSSQQWVSFGNFGAYAPNTNYHIVVTVRRGSYQASHFVNGNLVQVATISHSNTITPGSSYRYNIGQDLGGAPYYGNILLHKLYNTALSADQVKQNYKQYKSRFNLS